MLDLPQTSINPDLSHSNAHPSIKFPPRFFELIRNPEFRSDIVLDESSRFAEETQKALVHESGFEYSLNEKKLHKKKWDSGFGIIEFQSNLDGGLIYIDPVDRKYINDRLNADGSKKADYESWGFENMYFKSGNTISFIGTLFLQNIVCNYVNSVMEQKFLLEEED